MKADQINSPTGPSKETLRFERQDFVIDSRTTGTPTGTKPKPHQSEYHHTHLGGVSLKKQNALG